jgi:hypothetical protein
MKYLVLCDHHQAVIEQDTPDQARLLFSCGRCQQKDVRIYQATEDDCMKVLARR